MFVKAGIIVYVSSTGLIINNFLKCTAKFIIVSKITIITIIKFLLMLTIYNFFSKNAELSVHTLIIKYSHVVIVQLLVMHLLVIQ